MKTYIAYIRTSTKAQTNGLEAQQRAIRNFIASEGGEVISTFIEQVSGAKDNRAELAKALKACRKEGHTLLVSKLDRVSRKVSFIANLMESRIDLKVAELPNADTFQLHIYAALAEQERKLISERTKAALQVRKEAGVKLGSPLNEKRSADAIQFSQGVLPAIHAIKQQGINSLSGIARQLNENGIATFAGGKWYPQTVKNCLAYVSS
jgi:DNA invertase Pin-like site-specific DNA recombinase